MPTEESRALRGLLPLLVVSAVIVLVVFGLARGLWLSNLHNGLLAVAFAIVGAYVYFQRPGHIIGWLCLATGAVEALLFLGRQVGKEPSGGSSQWLGWLGVWPIAIALLLTTLSVFYFPDGRLPSPKWRGVVAAAIILAVVCAAWSALWPVEYGSAGVATGHPINADAPLGIARLWSAIAHPTYVLFQLLWVLALATRWRKSTGHARAQVACLALAAAISGATLVVGLVVWQTPRPGILSTALVPIAAGWAIVRGQHLAAYSALSWLSRTGFESRDLPSDLAKAVAQALEAPSATLWIGSDNLHPVGVWPETDNQLETTTLAALHDSPVRHVIPVTKDGTTFGALSVQRARTSRLSLAERRLFDDLAAHAHLVIEHIGMEDLIARQRPGGRLEGLTSRENDVLELVARGFSNAAICQELHLSIKSVEPIIGSVFTKLGLNADNTSNRRVLAALAYYQTHPGTAPEPNHQTSI